MKYINKIGYEIEGLWKYDCYALEENLGGDFVDDGSVGFRDDEFENSDDKVIEYRSKPRKQLTTIKRDLEKINKYFIKGNDTCGFHIHFSFKQKEMLSLLVNNDFVEYFLKIITKKYPEMVEERKHSGYCGTEKEGNKTLFGSLYSGYNNRYRAVNFNSYNKHGTIEIRLFEMFNIEDCLEYVEITTKIIEDYLEKASKKNALIKTEIKNLPIEIKTITITEKIKLKQKICVK